MKKLLARVAPYRKAVGALLAPAGVVLLASLLPGSDGGSAITSAELGTALTAALGAAGIVYKVRNGRVTVDVDLEKARAALLAAGYKLTSGTTVQHVMMPPPPTYEPLPDPVVPDVRNNRRN